MRNMRAMLKQKDGQRTNNEPERSALVQPRGLWYKDQLPEGTRLSQEAVGYSADDSAASNGTGDSYVAGSGPYLWPTRYQDRPVQDTTDVIETGQISLATARQLFDTYKSDLYPHYPLVFIPSSVTADEMRKTKPALFLAIIAAASSKEDPELAATLDKEILQLYATRSMILSQKSLELVQALLVSAVW